MSDLGTGFVGGDHRDDARGHLDGLLVRVDLDVRAGDLGELADLDVLAEQGGRLFDGDLDGAVLGVGRQELVGVVRVGGHGVAEHGVGEFDELRGLGHEVGLRIELDGVTGLAFGGLDHLGGDGAFLGLAAFALASGLDALGADDLLGAGDITLGLGESLLEVHQAGAGVFAHLLDQSCSDCCH